MRSTVESLWHSIQALPRSEKFVFKTFFFLSIVGLFAIILGIVYLLITRQPIATFHNLNPETKLASLAVVTDQEVSSYQNYASDRHIAPDFKKLYLCGDLEAPNAQWLHYYVYQEGQKIPVVDKPQMVETGSFCILLEDIEWVSNISYQVSILCGRKLLGLRTFRISPR